MPSAPKAPDPYATANAQAQANKQAVYDSASVNQINQNTPYGSQSWSGTIGQPDRTVTTTFSPDEQKKYDLLNSVIFGMGDHVQNRLGQITDQPFDLSGLPSRQFGGLTTNLGSVTSIPGSQGPDASVRAQINQSYTDAFNKAGMSEADFAKSPDFAGFQAKLNDYYNKITDPSEIASQLAYQQGRVNDPIYGASAQQFVNTLQQRQQDTKNKYFGAVAPITMDIDRAGSAVRTFGDAGAIQSGLDTRGVTPLSTDFSGDVRRTEDALYSRQTARLDPQFQKARQDMETQLANQGITATSNPEAYYRAVQEFEQNKNDAYAAARNDAITGANSEQSTLFGQGLASRQQTFGEANTAGQFGNQAQAQKYGQLLGRASFYNTGQGQQFGQNLAGGQFQNQAQGQAFDQTLQGLNFQNTWNQQNQNFANTWGQQNQNSTNAARDSMINELLLQRQLPLQELSSLMTFNSPQLPQFGAPAQYQMQAPDISGLIMNNYNQSMNGRNALIGAIAGLGGMLGGGYLAGR